ncbi:MAG: aminomethyltransferase, partial [Gemmobacter sp.]
MLDHPYASVTPGPPRPSRILTPRSLSRHHGHERHVVAGGGAALVQIAPGDRLTIINDEGGQPAEIVAADRTGRIDAAILGEASNCGAEGLRAMLAAGEAAGEGLGRLRRGLATRGIDLGRAGALRHFDPETPAGARATLIAHDAGWIV